MVTEDEQAVDALEGEDDADDHGLGDAARKGMSWTDPTPDPRT